MSKFDTFQERYPNDVFKGCEKCSEGDCLCDPGVRIIRHCYDALNDVLLAQQPLIIHTRGLTVEVERLNKELKHEQGRTELHRQTLAAVTGAEPGEIVLVRKEKARVQTDTHSLTPGGPHPG